MNLKILIRALMPPMMVLTKAINSKYSIMVYYLFT
uniref:Uncharacterized protein n=1 Tax=Siphoviridae sp. ctu3K14 TaxID=2826500 RepID=A0A8S5NAC8_9CAUD|nr:MAG TPA: hypothetical protein [Siphoviridae sp. ctu3K14]